MENCSNQVAPEHFDEYLCLNVMSSINFNSKFPQERAVLAKERSVHMYRLSAYLIARNLSDLPLELVLPVIFLVIVYFMVGLKLTFSAFSLTLLTVFLSIIVAQVKKMNSKNLNQTYWF